MTTYSTAFTAQHHLKIQRYSRSIWHKNTEQDVTWRNEVYVRYILYNKVKYLSYPLFPDFQKCIPVYGKFPGFDHWLFDKKNTWMEMNREHCWNDTDKEKQNTRSKSCPIATWSAINLTRIGLGSNPNVRCDKPATNRLDHGTVSSA
jgi:hypothetical protein